VINFIGKTIILRHQFLSQYLDVTRKYIENQEIHHHKKTFNEEYNDFLEKLGFQVFED